MKDAPLAPDKNVKKNERLRRILLWICVGAYVLVPFDILPEALMGPVGFLDDAGLVGYAFARTIGMRPYALLKRWLK